MNDPRRPFAIDPNAGGAAPVDRDGLRERYASIRAHSVNLVKPLSEEDCCVQSMPDASPVKWHLGHTSWFFETFVLEKFEASFAPFLPAFRVMFNSYYNGIGEKFPRAQRGLLTRPALHEVMLYRKKVNERMEKIFAQCENDAALRTLVDLGLHHEQQHQELILTDVKHLFSLNPLKSAYREWEETNSPVAAGIQWHAFDGGVAEIGYAGDGFCFDNETPRHKQYLNAYALASRLVTNGEYLDFIADGGYRDPRLWLSEGWDWIQVNKITHPIYWERGIDRWDEFTLGGSRALDAAAPAVHISYFEADAYARWAGARLPSEAEWENAASRVAASEDTGRPEQMHPRPAGDKTGLQQLFGEAWQWTQSSYTPYPGYLWPTGAVGEYNGKFMVNQYVLRGSSCLTPVGHCRTTYRNFFPATARWQMTGIRLAKDHLIPRLLP